MNGLSALAARIHADNWGYWIQQQSRRRFVAYLIKRACRFSWRNKWKT